MAWLKDEEIKTEIDLMRSIAQRIVWDCDYHETKLPEVQRHLALVKTFLHSVGLSDVDVDDENVETDRDGEIIVNRPRDVAIDLLRGATYSVEHHEEALTNAYAKRAVLKALLLRGNFDFTIEEIEKDVQER